MAELLRKQDVPLPGVVTLVFNRPEKLNALSPAMLRALAACLDEIASDPQVRVVILRGAGGRAFIAGADITGYQGGRHQEFIDYQHLGRKVFDRLETLPQPTLAVVDGYALGGGLEIALCCDLIVCSERAQLGLPEGRLGLCPGGGGTVRLTRALGKYVASDIMLAAWRIDGAQACRLGLAATCVAGEELEDAVLKRLRAMLKVAPLAQTAMKQLIREGLDREADAAKTIEQEELFRLYGTADGQEGINAYLEKRDPEFKGE